MFKDIYRQASIFLFVILNTATIFAYLQIHGLRPIIYALWIFYCIYLYLINSEFKRVFSEKSIVVYGILVVYHIINCKFHNVPLENGIIPYALSLLSNFFIMAVSCWLYLNDAGRSSKILSYSFLVFVVLALNQVSALGNYGRVGSDYIHPNQFAQTAAMGLFIMLLHKIHSSRSYIWLLAFFSIPISAIFLCGSRNGLLLLVLVFVAVLFSHFFADRKNSIPYFKLILISIILFVIGYYLIHNTIMGERFLRSNEIGDRFYVAKTGTILDLLGDREIYYILGWRNFIDNPIFGIGLRNFDAYNGWFGYPLHSEYLIHLTEGGLIGIFLYSYFIFIITSGLYNQFKKNKDNILVTLIISFIAYLFVGFTAREIYYSQFFPMLGILIARNITSASKKIFI